MTAIVLAAAAVLIIGVSNAATWAITRIRNERYGYKRGYEAGWMYGNREGYQEGFGAGEMHHATEYGEVTR